jgi:hypothetical protein
MALIMLQKTSNDDLICANLATVEKYIIANFWIICYEGIWKAMNGQFPHQFGQQCSGLKFELQIS